MTILGMCVLLPATLHANSLIGNGTENGMPDRYLKPISSPYPEHVLQHYPQQPHADYPYADAWDRGDRGYSRYIQPAVMRTAVPAPMQRMQQPTGTQVLVVDQPKVDTAQLMVDVRKLQGALAERKDELQRSVTEKKFTPKDALITALLPGGILYGLIRKNQIDKINRQLAEVKSDLIDIDDVVLALQELVGTVMLAQVSEPAAGAATYPVIQLSETVPPISHSAPLVTLPLSTSNVISHSPASYPASYDTLLQSAW